MHAWKLVPRMNRRQTAATLAAAALMLSWTAAAEACPMCKAALGTNADRFIHAWGLSIVFMLSMPFLLVSSFSLYMYYLVRRARAEQAAKEAAASLERADARQPETAGV